MARLSEYGKAGSYLRQEHGVETHEEAGRALGRLMGERDHLNVQIADIVAAINIEWAAQREVRRLAIERLR